MSSSETSARHGPQAGFSLLELIAALVVIGLTLALAGGAFRVLARSGDIGTELIGRHDMLSRGIDALRHDIERMQRVALGKQEGNPQFAFAGEEATLTFVALEPPFPSNAGLFFIQYSILQKDGLGYLVRTRAPFDAGREIASLRTADQVTVLEGSYGFRFSYLERKDGRERWVARWTDRDSLPGLVRLEILDRVPTATPLPPLVFRPRVEAEQGCVKQGLGPCAMPGALPAPAAAPPERKQ